MYIGYLTLRLLYCEYCYACLLGYACTVAATAAVFVWGGPYYALQQWYVFMLCLYICVCCAMCALQLCAVLSWGEAIFSNKPPSYWACPFKPFVASETEAPRLANGPAIAFSCTGICGVRGCFFVTAGVPVHACQWVCMCAFVCALKVSLLLPQLSLVRHCPLLAKQHYCISCRGIHWAGWFRPHAKHSAL